MRSTAKTNRLQKILDKLFDELLTVWLLDGL